MKKKKKCQCCKSTSLGLSFINDEEEIVQGKNLGKNYLLESLKRTLGTKYVVEFIRLYIRVIPYGGVQKMADPNYDVTVYYDMAFCNSVQIKPCFVTPVPYTVTVKA
ncbi:hypothetical protein TNCV_2000601 [Trichonephila clavipes]|nr:hypothetical protein TNCV_2000601 [Trichonephila clavipes]